MNRKSLLGSWLFKKNRNNCTPLLENDNPSVEVPAVS